jgi:hypothetical protein
MAIPETTDTAAPTPQRPSKKLLAGMIISQILSILLIIGMAFLGFVLSALGGGGLGYMNLMFFGPLLLLIPIVASWVAYKKNNARGALILTSLPWLFFCLDAIAVAMLWFYLQLISSGP